jgi:glycosyltransferase involved in cell wall biosynthesis
VKIGLMTYLWQDMESLHYLARLTDVVLRDRHELLYCPPQYLHLPRNEQKALIKQWVQACDVLIAPVDAAVLEARSELGDSSPPCITFLMGGPSRGGNNLAGTHKYLRTSDTLVGNCVAEVEQCKKLLPNARVRMLPFPVDDTKFYHETAQNVEKGRAYLGIDANARVLLYSGRITIEKNVHTVLKVFSAVQREVPESYLVVAGTETNAPFAEFGVFSLGVTRMLTKLVPSLEIDSSKIRFVGQRGSDELRTLYNVADLLLNFTLNHDENFGVAQVEAMLCGTRVIGSNWGGLRDTIVEDVTGNKVSTILTQSGVKVNWWEAAATVVRELRSDADRETLRQNCRAATLERYSLARYREDLESLIAESKSSVPSASEGVKPSAFAQELWRLFKDGDGVPPYRRGPNAQEIYQELVTPLMGTAETCKPPGVNLNAKNVLCLATPVVLCPRGRISINDPIFPMDLTVPEDLQGTVEKIMQEIQKEPVISVDLLASRLQVGSSDLLRALTWMSETGLVLNTICEDDLAGIQPIGPQFAQPVFNIRRVDHSDDVVYVS